MLLRWRESKRSGIPLFPVKTASELSRVQLWLLHWLEIYDWVLSLPEVDRPRDDVIENDELFDAWYKSYVARLNRDYRMAHSGGSGNSASAHKEVIKF